MTNAVNVAALGSTGVSPGFKNRIINGGMVIDQRNAGASVTNTAGQYLYVTDRFSIYGSQASKYTGQQNAGSVTPPVGFANYLGITSSSAYSITSTDQFNINHKIEGFNIADLGWGTANAKTVTLSFQVYSSLTGTFGGALNNSNNSRSYPFSYSIPVANTWTTISVTIAGDTTGTWQTTNGIGIWIFFSLGTGSALSNTAGSWAAGSYLSATGATSVVGTNGATFYITGVQLEVGTQATPFEYRQYGQELALCQRYFYKAVPGVVNGVYGFGYVVAADYGQVSVQYPVPMRTSPTLTSSGNFLAQQYNLNGTPTSLSLQCASPLTASVQYNGSSGGVVGVGVKLLDRTDGSSSISFNSEL